MEWNQVVSRNVRHLRQAKHLTQEQLSLEAGLDLTYIGGIERGRRNPTVKVLGQIAAVLGVEPADLLRAIAPQD